MGLNEHSVEHDFNAPEGHQFQPYWVGTPSQIVHKGEDIIKEEED